MPDTLKLLMVEDSEDDALLTLNALKNAGFSAHTKRVETASDLEAALDSESWDAIISDFKLPTMTTLDALRIFKLRGLSIPFIVVSGTIGEEIAVALMRAGAHDYILKDNVTRLAPALRRELSDAKERRAQRESQEALAESENRYISLFEQSRDAIYLAGLKGEIVDVNPAALKLFGYSREELHTTNLFDLFQFTNGREDFTKQIETRGFTDDCEAVFTRPDGAKFECTMTAVVRRRRDHQAIGVQGVVRDVTEQRLLMAQLLQAQKMEVIGTLASGIAHDFNNILAVIMGYTAAVRRDFPDYQELQDDLSKVLQAGERAKKLIRQIMTISRKYEAVLVPLQVQTVIDEVQQFLRASLPSTIEFQTHIDSSTPTVLADPTQLSQVLMNLCTNAAQAMQGQPGRMEIRLDSSRLGNERDVRLSSLPPGKYVKLSVRDTGCGMNEQTIKKIFDPFFTTKAVGEGTGLGLATAYSIVKAHGGAICVDSEVGNGTTFEIYLPYSGQASGPEDTAKSPIPRGAERVLVVDDEEPLAELMRRTLSDLGYQVTAKTSAVEALDAFRNNPRAFDLVITDQTMPRITGKELAKAIYAIRDDLPVLLVSGFPGSGLSTEPKDEAIAGVLPKPYDMESLGSAVRRILDKRT